MSPLVYTDFERIRATVLLTPPLTVQKPWLVVDVWVCQESWSYLFL
jgi:hypothetical protein